MSKIEKIQRAQMNLKKDLNMVEENQY